MGMTVAGDWSNLRLPQLRQLLGALQLPIDGPKDLLEARLALHLASVRETHLLRCHFILKVMILPRQARDKHRENSKKEWRFPQGDGVQTAQTDLELLFSIVAVRKLLFCFVEPFSD